MHGCLHLLPDIKVVMPYHSVIDDNVNVLLIDGMKRAVRFQYKTQRFRCLADMTGRGLCYGSMRMKNWV